MDVVVPEATDGDAALPSLPLLSPPRGEAQRNFRRRHNELNEGEDEALRAQLRQHIGRSAVSADEGEDGGADAAASTGTGVGAALSALWPAAGAVPWSIGELRKALHRFLRFADEDMAEEVDAADPKVQAGSKFLAGVDEFAALGETELAQLVSVAEFRAFDAGDVVLPDERAADGLFVVVSGEAGRFPASAGSLDATRPTATFGYQQHFGVAVVAPPAGIADPPETQILCVTDVLECLWLPALVVRMLNLQPRLEFEFALVLHDPRSGQLQDAHEQLVRRLLRAGLHAAVLAGSRHSARHVVLLLRAPLWLLAREDKLMAMERILESHADDDSRGAGDDYEDHGETMSASDRVAAFASILTRSASDKPPGAGLRGIENNQDTIVKDIFPLHDPSVVDLILASSWAYREGHAAAYKRLFLLRLKDYFGLRVAFFMAFVRLYNSALVTPSTIGLLLWLFLRWMDYRSYLKALGIYGLALAFVWAPSFLKRWARYQNSLLVEWNLLGTREVPQPNPEFRDFCVETLNVAGPGEPPDLVEVKTYDSRRRWPKFAFFFVFCFVCLVLLFVFVGIYVQWYIIAVMTPMCTDPRCPEFLDAARPGGCEAHCAELFGRGKSFLFMKQITSCAEYCDTTSFDHSYYRCDAPLVGCFETERGIVGTARWFYVLVQGVVLGLTLDIVFLAVFEAIAQVFNRWENYATDQENEARVILKVFLFNWVGYFYWFFLLAFVYVPNGADVQLAIRDYVDSNPVFTFNDSFRFSRYWIDGLISMDSAFVTPMIVTQALNLLINTFVPYLLRRAIIRARDSYHVRKDRLSTALRKSRRAGVRPKSPSIDLAGDATNSEASSIDTSEGEYAPFAEPDPWVVLSDGMDRQELAKQFAEREPVGARSLDAAVRELFASISSHEQHMADMCGEVTRDDLDEFQRASYDWLDRIARSVEETGDLRAMTSSGVGSGANTEPRLRLSLLTHWQCRNYRYTADRVLEESSMGAYSPFGDLLHLAIQFSYTIMFSVVWPFCCFCSCTRNAVALRFDAIKMTIDCKRPVPRRTVGIGAWLGALVFEIVVAQVVVPALLVYVSGQLDAFEDDCKVTEARYGPVTGCLTGAQRLKAFCVLENVGIAVCVLVYLIKSDISEETRLKVSAHARKLRHSLRKSVRMIGESILVSTSAVTGPRAAPAPAVNATRPAVPIPSAAQDEGQGDENEDPSVLFSVDLNTASANTGAVDTRRLSVNEGGLRHRRPTTTSDRKAGPAADTIATSIEWREGTVSWVKNSRIKVNFSAGRKLSDSGAAASADASPYDTEVWLTTNERHVLMDPTPVRVFEAGMPVLLAANKFGRWLEASIVAVDSRDRLGNEVMPSPNEMHLHIVEAHDLRSPDSSGSVDPYCVVTVSSGATAAPPVFRHATTIKRRTTNPLWDEQLTCAVAAAELYPSRSVDSGNVGATSTPGATAQEPTMTFVVSSHDAFTRHESLGTVEIELRAFRDGRRHRLLVPLALKRRVWTLEALQKLQHKQALGGADYPLLGRPHLRVELQWIDTRLPTRVAVRIKGQRGDLVLSRRFCETNLCYGIRPEMVVAGHSQTL